MQEVVVFGHGLSNFGHNRGTKKGQEQLVTSSLRGTDTLARVYGVTGNYALTTPLSVKEIRSYLLPGLNVGQYLVKEIVIVERYKLMNALAVFVGECCRKYRSDFKQSDFGVGTGKTRRRLGLVFVQQLCDLGSTGLEGLYETLYGKIEVIGLHAGVVGLLKDDPPEPRIPWGAAAAFLEEVLEARGETTLATARSARTVRGALKLFETSMV